MVDANYTPEGFKKTGRKIDLPEYAHLLEPDARRKLAICNLFANHNQSIKDISRVLDESFENIVTALIEGNLILDRRRKTKKTRVERRAGDRYHISLVEGASGKAMAVGLCGVESVNAVGPLVPSLLKEAEVCQECLKIYQRKSH